MTKPRAVLLVVIVAVGAYANSTGNGFAYDDTHVVRDNPAVTDPSLEQVLWEPYWPRAPEGAGLYRPVVIGAFAVQWWVLRRKPMGLPRRERGRARIGERGPAHHAVVARTDLRGARRRPGLRRPPGARGGGGERRRPGRAVRSRGRTPRVSPVHRRGGLGRMEEGGAVGGHLGSLPGRPGLQGDRRHATGAAGRSRAGQGIFDAPGRGTEARPSRVCLLGCRSRRLPASANGGARDHSRRGAGTVVPRADVLGGGSSRPSPRGPSTFVFSSSRSRSRRTTHQRSS